jgi:hypothetical protein
MRSRRPLHAAPAAALVLLVACAGTPDAPLATEVAAPRAGQGERGGAVPSELGRVLTDLMTTPAEWTPRRSERFSYLPDSADAVLFVIHDLDRGAWELEAFGVDAAGRIEHNHAVPNHTAFFDAASRGTVGRWRYAVERRVPLAEADGPDDFVVTWTPLE